MSTDTPEMQKVEVAEDTVVLNLTIGKVTNRRKVSSDHEGIQTDIDRDMLHVSVDLYDSEELRKCESFLSNLKTRIRQLSMPSLLKGGLYTVKHEAVKTVDEMVRKAQKDFRPLVEAFAAVAEEREQEAKTRLGSAFDPNRYPTKGQILEIFSIQFNWFTFGTPDSLMKIDKDMFERERNKKALMVEQAADMATRLLAMEAKGLADHLVDRLTPDVDGNPKRLNKRAIEKITEFLNGFNLRNCGSSKELERYMEEMREILEGVDAPTLRVDDTLKNTVKQKFERLSGALDNMVVTETRFIEFGEEEEDV
jgi:hypothetical protein